MSHPRNKYEHKNTYRQEKEKVMRNTRNDAYAYPWPRYMTYARNRGYNFRHRPVDYDYWDEGQHFRYDHFLGEYADEPTYVKRDGRTTNKHWHKRYANRQFRRNVFIDDEDGSCRGKAYYKRVYDLWWTLY